jgi:hypothetical protein
MHLTIIRWIVKAALFTALVSQVSAEAPDSKHDASFDSAGFDSAEVSFEPEADDDDDGHHGPCCCPSHSQRHQRQDRRNSRLQQSLSWPGSEIGHYQFPYHSYRRPWYYPGQPIYNRTIAW